MLPGNLEFAGRLRQHEPAAATTAAGTSFGGTQDSAEYAATIAAQAVSTGAALTRASNDTDDTCSADDARSADGSSSLPTGSPAARGPPSEGRLTASLPSSQRAAPSTLSTPRTFAAPPAIAARVP